jgi:methionyl-tRNA synthetase
MEKETVSFPDFSKLDLRTARIISAEEVQGKDKLFKLTIEVGEEKRVLVAGLREFYSKEELEGKTIIIVANLEPKKLAGIISHGMLLAAENEEKVSLLTIDKELPSGSKIH